MKDIETQALTAEDKVKRSHNYLKNFLKQFNEAKRGGIHDFIEIAMANMIQQAIQGINEYLATGHKQVSANEVTMIVVDSWHRVLDNMKRNLESAKAINFE